MNKQVDLSTADETVDELVAVVDADETVVAAEQAEAVVDTDTTDQEGVKRRFRQHNQQQELPFAVIQGKPVTEIPQDLYIPPDALEVFLEAFEGPLDLLLYLIKRQNMDVLEICVADITRQYMDYVELMKAVQFELAAEYLVMAAMLAEIKSRMLLPRTETVEEEEEADPRAELIRRLLEYERFKKAAEDLDNLPREGRDYYPVSASPPTIVAEKQHPDVDLKEILLALSGVLKRAELSENHQIEQEALSTRERMTQVLSMLSADSFTPFVSLFKVEEGRLGVVVTFLAVMELIKESLVEIVQTEPFAPIHVKAKAVHDDGTTSD
ncbi:segregation/condensation protein A [Endozoicomonas sp. SM1973]|uniref:Segregation and condensation protein A n=1 Tax=Spartinivicinus marinus TaxID=2994442 RepID=A0A853IAB1_9GAMM|nr:ScpA family protein [Spartinivicinus marinus]MCX4028775.1 ScpA family protein [Spartinivicinus marinus]NYZ67588.1 segregation/condensation protein A [Spartinivicinus marinus]